MKISKGGASKSPWTSCQCSVTPTAKKCFLMFRQMLLCFSFCPWPLVAVPDSKELVSLIWYISMRLPPTSFLLYRLNSSTFLRLSLGRSSRPLLSWWSRPGSRTPDALSPPLTYWTLLMQNRILLASFAVRTHYWHNILFGETKWNLDIVAAEVTLDKHLLKITSESFYRFIIDRKDELDRKRDFDYREYSDIT